MSNKEKNTQMTIKKQAHTDKNKQLRDPIGLVQAVVFYMVYLR